MLMKTHENRLSDLRKELEARGLDGFVVPISDEHMSEYVGAYAQRLRWLTGFGGSAGSAIVLRNKAAIFTDGRYTIQVREQVDGELYDYEPVPFSTHVKWLAANGPEGGKIGYDAWLHGREWVAQVSEALAKVGGELVAVEGNPIDAVWHDQPEPSPALAVPHDDKLAGRSSADKRGEVADWLREENLDAVAITALDSVAWLLNMRGSDVDNTPVALSYAIAHADGTAELFIAPEKVSDALARALGNAVTVRPCDEFHSALGDYTGKRIAADPDSAVAGIFQSLEAAGAEVVAHRDPVLLAKAMKNAAEVQGHRNAQATDGAAVTKFLLWLQTEASKGGQDELSAAAQLEQFRREARSLHDLSFNTISAAGAHGALCHYKVDEQSNAPIEPGSVFLCDSGGQYDAGTTDITRTVWIPSEAAPTPPAEVRDRFTRVLKGHIALACATFPPGTTGGQLDALARQYLWAAGLDYAHGTGHGVGSYLSVHEGPQRIAKPGGGQAGTGEELRAGMICSNEPGYYKAGEYGIRIENLVLIVERDIDSAEDRYLGFDTLTCVPIARNMVDVDMLSPQDIGWWNAYHAKTRDILAPQLAGDVREWLETACAPL